MIKRLLVSLIAFLCLSILTMQAQTHKGICQVQLKWETLQGQKLEMINARAMVTLYEDLSELEIFMDVRGFKPANSKDTLLTLKDIFPKRDVETIEFKTHIPNGFILEKGIPFRSQVYGQMILGEGKKRALLNLTMLMLNEKSIEIDWKTQAELNDFGLVLNPKSKKKINGRFTLSLVGGKLTTQ